MNIIEFLSSNIKNPYVLITVLSMLPLSEIKGGILLGLSLKLNPFYVFGVCYLGSSIPVPIILLILNPILKSLRKRNLNKLATRFENSILAKFSYMGTDKHIFWKLLSFVAAPLPLTGSYSGSCVAALLDVPLHKGFLAVLIGNLISGGIVLTIGLIFKDYADKVLYGFLILIPVVLIISLVKRKLHTKKIK